MIIKRLTATVVIYPILLFCLNAWADPSNTLTKKSKEQIIRQEWHKKVSVAPAVHELNQVSKMPEQVLLTKGDDLPKEYQQKISLFAEGLKLSEVLKPIEEAVKANLVLGPGIEDKRISVSLKDIAISKALGNILFPLGYGFKHKEGNLVILAQETRAYHLLLPPLTQGFNELTSNESSVDSSSQSNTVVSNPNSNQQIKLGTKIVVSNESAAISFWEDIKDNLRSLLSPEGKFSINKPGGEVIVTDSPVSLLRVSAYFDDLNDRVTQQMEVDVKVVEVFLDKDSRFGVDWNALADHLKTFNSIGMATNFAAENFSSGSLLKISGNGSKPGSGVSESGVGVVIQALSKQGHVEIVSQPRVKILNNQVAVIQVGSTQSFIDQSSIQVTQTGTITTLSTSQVQEGVTMRLLGNMVGSDIYLSVAPVITTIDKIRSITSGNTTIEAPQTTTKSINTMVRLKEGEAVAIGGLITSTTRKNKEEAPVLSKIPLIGRLFQYTEDVQSKRELVIFITPRRG